MPEAERRPQATPETSCEGCDTNQRMRPELVVRWWCGQWICEDCLAELRAALGEEEP
jgi:hypothetical protein